MFMAKPGAGKGDGGITRIADVDGEAGGNEMRGAGRDFHRSIDARA